MRLSLLASLGIAAFLGVVATATPDANAQARRTIMSSPGGTTVVTRRPGRMSVMRSPRRVAAVRGLRGARGAVIVRRPGLRGARGAVIVRRPGLRGARGAAIVSRPGLRCRTVIVNGVRVRRCF